MSSLQCFCIVICLACISIAILILTKVLSLLGDILLAIYKILKELNGKWDRG